MCSDLYNISTDYLPYGSYKITNESSLIFLRAYSSEIFWRLLFALNITNIQDNTPICLSRYGEILFRQDVELALSKYYLKLAKSRIEQEIALNRQTILRLQAEAKLASVQGKIQKMERIYQKIDICLKKNFPSPSLEKEITQKRNCVEKATEFRKETIRLLTAKAILIGEIESGRI